MFFNIQRWSLHDGQGIRTTLFFKGCPLRCRWCSNPESWDFEETLMVNQNLCTGCRACLEACPSKAIEKTARGTLMNPDACILCGDCVQACPYGAREILGGKETLDDVIDTIERDAVFYRASGGGVTFSGGEAFSQPDLLRRLADRLIAAGIPTAVETCGYFDFGEVRDIFDLIGDIFIDLKHSDDILHQAYTGVSNGKILENIRHINASGRKFTIRLPLVKGMTDTPGNINGVAEICKDLQHLARIELLPYHPLGEPKYAGLNLPYDHTMMPPEPERIQSILSLFHSKNLEAECIGVINEATT